MKQQTTKVNPSKTMLLTHYSGQLFVPTLKVIQHSMNRPIRYVTPHFARYRSRAKITVLMCEKKPYPLWFSYRRKCEHSLRHSLGKQNKPLAEEIH